MLKRRFGSGVEVPVIGQGTWMMEGDHDTKMRAVEILRLGLDLGLTHVDAAEMYGDGRVEQLVDPRCYRPAESGGTSKVIGIEAVR